jgi:predicted kinase
MLSFSFDDLRLEWYHPTDYAKAFQLSTQDRSFDAKASQRFQSMVETHEHIFIDNTNLTPKRRKIYIELAHKYDYKTIAIILNTPLETLIERQTTRGDKNVPEEAVRHQYNSMVLPTKGEFNQVIKVHHETKSNKG